MYGRRVVIPTLAVVVVTAAAPLLAQRGNSTTQKTPPPSPQQQDFQALGVAVDAALMSDLGITLPAAGAPPSAPITPKPLAFGAGDRTEGAVSVKWRSNHFLKAGNGETYLAYTLAFDRSQLAKGAALYVRIVSAEQAEAFAAYTAAAAAPPQSGKAPPARPMFGWESVGSVEVPSSGEISRAAQLKPGQYVAFVAAKERSAAAPVGLLRHELVVPDYNRAELLTSSVIVAQSVEALPPSTQTNQESNPYVIGPMRIIPSFDHRFAKSGELIVFFFIYGAKDAATGKPDVVVDFRFHQRLAEGEKYFNRMEPQQINAQTLPAEFSAAAGHQLRSDQGLRLASFPVGDYRLEIKVTDRPGGRELTQSVNFSVVE
ncbi:MAG TPA: hypothetical protein VFO58_02400 [Vicinamibacterales bacterium]|nr:hypothetical protein [Vicinamibacterales bacterium]